MANQENWPDDPNVERPAVKQKSSGGCWSVVLIVGGLGLFVMLLCCGIGGWMVYSLMPKLTSNPAEVAEIGKQVIDLQIPDDFQADTAMTIDNFAMTMRMANFRQKDNKGTLLLGDFQLKFGNPDQKLDIQQKRDQNNSKDGLKLEMGDSQVREFEVRGKQVPFRFSDAVDQDTKTKFRVVEGDLEGPKGGAFIKLIIESEAYDDDAVVKMIESIR